MREWLEWPLTRILSCKQQQVSIRQAGRQGGKGVRSGRKVAEWRQLICVKIILGCWRKV